MTAVVVALALVAAVEAATLLARSNDSPEASESASSTSGSTTGPTQCSGPTIRAVVASTYAPVLRAAQRALGPGSDCVNLQVEIGDGYETAEEVGATSDSKAPDLWIPDDAAWNGTAVEAPSDEAHKGATLAVSPLYLVADKKVAAQLQRAGSSWLGTARLVSSGSGVRLAVRDPKQSGEGMLALGDLAESIWVLSDTTGMDQSAAALNDTYRYARTVTGSAKAWPRADEVGIVAESSILADPDRVRSLVVMSGRDHTALMRYTWYPSDAAIKDPERRKALDRVYAALHSNAADRARQAAGLRAPDLDPVTKDAVTPNPTAKPFDILPEHHVYHVFSSWYPGDRISSDLIVVDVSGSMGDNAPGAQQSIMALVRSSCREMARLLPDSASLGLWKFGSQLPEAGGRDYKPLTPLAKLTSGHRQRVAAVISGLKPQPTGTGLYDTILGSYRYATSHYRKDVANVVMIVTDGRNEDDANSISLGGLRRDLKSSTQSTRPVAVIIAAVGDKPDADALTSAVEPIGGRVVRVKSTDELGALFIHVSAGAAE